MTEDILITGPITREMISSKLKHLGSRTDSGGHSVFLGQVRADILNGKKVRAIEYSAYNTMVVKETEGILNIIHSEFSDVKSVDILHSVGIVMAGEISMFVLVSAGHRHQAIKACSKTVELLKEKLPIWKKEIFDDNTHEWQNDNLA
jgi:molybdopterin synthase catalytic subunit